MKKTIILGVLFFVMLSLLVVFFKGIPQDIYNNRQDKDKWINLLNHIEANEVDEVSLDMYELDVSDKENIIECLKGAEFYKSNWRQEGPTGNILYIIFKDNKELYFSYWGGGILETTYDHGQFLIVNTDLEILIDELKKRN